MNIVTTKTKTGWRADCTDLPGSPPVGLGKTEAEAIVKLARILIFITTGGPGDYAWWHCLRSDADLVLNGKVLLMVPPSIYASKTIKDAWQERFKNVQQEQIPKPAKKRINWNYIYRYLEGDHQPIRLADIHSCIDMRGKSHTFNRAMDRLLCIRLTQEQAENIRKMSVPVIRYFLIEYQNQYYFANHKQTVIPQIVTRLLNYQR